MIINWSSEDSRFLVTVSQLLGCMADGRTYQEAVVNAKIIILEWIDTAKKQDYPWFLKIKPQKKRNHPVPQT